MDAARVNVNAIAKHWIESSDRDFKTMNHLFKTKDYSWSLFLGHLVIEKLLKGYFVIKTGKNPPFLHNLLKIAEKSGIEISDENKLLLDEISTYNLNARYDNVKKEFYKKCDSRFTSLKLKEIKKIRKWIKGQL
jgi:HEPN domain-containing protein